MTLFDNIVIIPFKCKYVLWPLAKSFLAPEMKVVFTRVAISTRLSNRESNIYTKRILFSNSDIIASLPFKLPRGWVENPTQ